MLSACRGKLWDKKPDAPLGPLQVTSRSIFWLPLLSCAVLTHLLTCRHHLLACLYDI